MESVSKKRYARTPKNILLALGCSPSPAMRRELREWRLWPGFPKKQRNGFDIAELEAWAVNNAAKIVQRKKLSKMLQEGEDVTASDIKIFKTPVAGVPSFAVGADEYPEVIEGMDRLGALIMRRFAGRLTMEVRRMQIQNWKKLLGVAKRPGLVPFPSPKESNRYDVRECFAWIEKWILVDSQIAAGDLFGGAANLDVKIKEVNLRRALREEEFSKGSLIPFSLVTSYLAGLAGRIEKFYDRLLEGNAGLRRVIADTCRAESLPDAAITRLDEKLKLALAGAHDGVKAEFTEARDFALAEFEKIRKEQAAG